MRATGSASQPDLGHSNIFINESWGQGGITKGNWRKTKPELGVEVAREV
jgi:hypothetical protein